MLGIREVRYILAVALAAVTTTAAAQTTDKSFYAEFVNGGYISAPTVTLHVFNTSTAPATINTVVVCNTTGLTITAPSTLRSDIGGLAGNVVPYAGCGASGGVLIKDFTGLKRRTNATFVLNATVSGSCSDSAAVRVFASTGNTTSFTADFIATTSSTSSTPASNPPSTQLSTSVYPNCDGQINCGQPLPVSFTNNGAAFDPWEPGQALSTRQLFNSDGQACQLVPYDFRNALLQDNTVLLLWPQNGTQRAAVFRNHVTGQLKTLSDPMSFPTSQQPQFAWEFINETTPDPTKIIDGLMCLDSEYPRPYAQLAAALPATLPSYPYQFSVSWTSPGPIVPGVDGDANVSGIQPYADPAGWKMFPNAGVYFEFNVDGERIRAKVVSATGTASAGTAVLEILSAADRGLGGTTATSHDANDFVLSLVMPIDTRAGSPYYNKVVRACVISHGIRMYSPNPGSQASQYFPFLEYFDGDGWVLVR